MQAVAGKGQGKDKAADGKEKRHATGGVRQDIHI
jgi:hypothetical protein